MATGSQNLTTYVSNTLAPRINNISLSNFIDGSKLIYTYYGGGNSINDKPTNVDAFGAMSFKTADSWYGQLLMSSNQATGLYWRTATSLSGGWCKLLDSSNYTDYTVTKTGDGASGTWGISINGNAATATKTMQDGSGNVITSKYVTIDTVQAITGAKIFKDIIYSEAGVDNPLIKKTVDLSTLDANTYYPVTSDRLPYRGFNHMKLAVHLNSGTKPSWSTHNDGFGVILDVLATAHGWGTIANRTVILQSDYSFANAHPASYSQMGHSSTAVFWLRGGGKYFIYTDFNTNWTIQTAAYTVSEETVQPTTTRPAINVTRSIIQTDIDGNAATATKATQDDSGNTITSTYVAKTGDVMSGRLSVCCSENPPDVSPGSATIELREAKRLTRNSSLAHSAANAPRLGFHWGGRYWAQLALFDNRFRFYNANFSGYYGVQASAVYGAVWNDYAEMRNVPEANIFEEKEDIRNIKLAGRCVREVGDDTMILSTERMQQGCKIISDTFGFNIGETDNCKTPIAVSGRALVYIYEGRETAKKHIGKPVCSGPDGTVSIMTDKEYIEKGYCCVGIISSVPEYEIWGSGNIQVNNRIWIYVR